MSRFIEIHLLQNFAPSNLNRDEVGMPKECYFGGVRRMRISSQSLKRATRLAFRESDLIAPVDLAVRTTRIRDLVTDRLVERGKVQAEARDVAGVLLAGIQLGVDGGRTPYLLFVGQREVTALADLCVSHWDELLPLVEKIHGGTGNEEAPANRTSRARQTTPRASVKKAGKDLVPLSIRIAASACLDGGQAVDLALFGRMLADLPERDVDGACQMAHALSTNEALTEFDFFTGIDDLDTNEDKGAQFLGTSQFSSACFYRYVALDVSQLRINLQDDSELAVNAVTTFLYATVAAIPAGKQHSFAAHNPPSFVYVVARDDMPFSLANAFLQPIRPSHDRDLLDQSVLALDEYWRELTAMYSTIKIRGSWVAMLKNQGKLPLTALRGNRVDSFPQLVERLVASVL